MIVSHIVASCFFRFFRSQGSEKYREGGATAAGGSPKRRWIQRKATSRRFSKHSRGSPQPLDRKPRRLDDVLAKTGQLGDRCRDRVHWAHLFGGARRVSWICNRRVRHLGRPNFLRTSSSLWRSRENHPGDAELQSKHGDQDRCQRQVEWRGVAGHGQQSRAMKKIKEGPVLLNTRGHQIKTKQTATYLGSTFHIGGGSKEEVMARPDKAGQAQTRLAEWVWRSRTLSVP